MKLDGTYSEFRGKTRRIGNVRDVNGESLYIDSYLYWNLMQAKANAKKYNGDIVIVIDGEEGSGKSTLARQIARVLDPKFNEKKITFSSEKCILLHGKGGDWESIVLDESKEDLDRKGAMSKKNKHFMNFLSQSRQCHKFFICILPSIYDLDKYIAEHRSRFLIHTYKHRGRRPGFFEFYSRKGIKKLFQFGAKYRTYDVTKAKFRGRFTKQEVVDLTRYEEYKRRAIQKYFDEAEAPKTEKEIIKEYIMSRCKEVKPGLSEIGINFKQFCNILGIADSTMYRWFQDSGEPIDF